MEKEIFKEIDAAFSEETEELDEPEKIHFIEMKNQKGDNVVLDLNPKNFEKQKDHLFFDFFSIYAKSFIKNKNGSESS